MNILFFAVLFCGIATLLNLLVFALNGSYMNGIAALLLLFATGASGWEYRRRMKP